jgi:hypothetical protein
MKSGDVRPLSLKILLVCTVLPAVIRRGYFEACLRLGMEMKK